MKWFDRWFYRQAKKAWDNKHEYETSPNLARGNTIEAVESDPHELNDGLRINVKRVIGGSLVTFRNYDNKRDRHENRTYIITEDQDFERELGKCITLESMRH